MQRRNPSLFFLLACALPFVGSAMGLFAEDEIPAKTIVAPEHAANMQAGLKLFRDEVRGIFVKRCLDCHGGAATESEFDLSTREALLKGGAEGKVLVAGQAKESRLVKLITHELAPEMPYEESKLAKAEIDAIIEWIDLGAPYDGSLKPAEEAETPWTETKVDPAAKSYWAFQPLKVADPPTPKNPSWARTPIDRFVLAKLEDKGLTPNLSASPRKLIRRLYFDLIGLPPTPEEVDAFLKDCGLNPAQAEPAGFEVPIAAIEKLVDRLLDSPHYGERWGRHWLDVARFAESHGFEQDYDRPYAFHYRDFVIKALNQDMPYNQFVGWQLAGDELAPEDPLAMMATGFLGAGVFPTQLTEKEFESARYDEMDDMLATMGTAMLGLTIGCARCHDHKFDPIPQADYFRMLSTFTETIRSEIDLKIPKPGSEEPIVEKVMVCSEGLPKMKHHADGRGFPHFYPQTYFLKRGDVNQKQGEAPQGFLQVLMRLEDVSTSDGPAALESHWRTAPPEGAKTSYRRRAMADWITDTEAGAGHLLARVIVNRVWHLHFQQGLVSTPNDFGKQGEPPSHPELLDWLANDLIQNGWKLKRLHRQILISRAYLQSADFNEAKSKIDPDNRLLWRYSPRRMEAEVIRDSLLAASGELDRTQFGQGTLDEGMKRKSIYFTIKRSGLIPMMQLFDQPEPLVSQGNRPATTIAPQALLLMNNPHIRGYARSMAKKLLPLAEKDSSEAVRQGYLLALSRPPSAEELRDNVEFLKSQESSYMSDKNPEARELALADFCQVLFSLNEFVFVE